MFTYFGGIDFSGAKEPLSNLWTALGEEVDGKLTIHSLRPHAFRQDLGAFVAEGWRGALGAPEEGRILWGADFPFGISAGAAEELANSGGGKGWARLVEWVADRPADEVRDAVADGLRGPRLTDFGGAMSPFDLRLYKQTVEGMRWLHQLREAAEVSIHPQAPDPAARVTLVEVYPSSTVVELGLPRRRAPGRPGETRARAAALRTFVRFADPAAEAIAVVLEDAWDATIACLTAWLARDDLDQPFRAAAAHPRATVQTEGWIYRPPSCVA